MSASREKKQRQGAGPSEKDLQAQQQQAAYKRKTITYTVIGVVIAILVAALLIWNSGFFQARATAATVGDTKLSAAELSYYYYGARMTAAQYAAYGLSSFDTSKADDEQVYNAENNTTYRDYFLESALSDAQWTLSLYNEALRRGHTDADVKADLDSAISNTKSAAGSYGYSYSAYLKAMYGSYMSVGTYEKLTRQYLLANLAYSEKLTELNDGYTQDDLTAYYEADDHADSLDTFEYSYLYFTPAAVDTKDADGNDIDEDTVNQQKEAALADAKAQAEQALAAVKNGDSIPTLADRYELADSNSGDHTTTVGVSNSALREKLVAMKEGDVELAENGTSGYYVVTLHSRKLVDTPTKDVRHILAMAENTTDEDGKLVAPTDEAWAAAKERIEAIQAEYEAGSKTEDSFAALANEKSDDGDGTTGGLYSNIDAGDSYVPEFLDWIFADGRAVGDTGIVQHTAAEGSTSGYYGYHFIYLASDTSEPVWMRSVRSTLASTDRNTWLEELESGYNTALTDGANYLGK